LHDLQDDLRHAWCSGARPRDPAKLRV
jgi:hypothetical protein